MNRSEKTKAEKELRRKYIEYRNLASSRWTAGTYVDIEPYQSGWKRKYVLRDDIKNRADAHEIAHILDLINDTKWSKRKDFLVRNWKTGKWEDMSQPLQLLRRDQYEALSEKGKSYFKFYERMEKIAFGGKRLVQGYRFDNEYFFVFEITPHMITRRYIPDAEIESRYRELTDHFERNNLWPKIDHMLGVPHRQYFTDVRMDAEYPDEWEVDKE